MWGRANCSASRPESQPAGGGAYTQPHLQARAAEQHTPVLRVESDVVDLHEVMADEEVVLLLEYAVRNDEAGVPTLPSFSATRRRAKVRGEPESNRRRNGTPLRRFAVRTRNS